jgi:hypothetical protein
MDNLLLIGAAVGMFVILPVGMSHLFLSEKEKAEVAAKSSAQRAFIQFCRIASIIFLLIGVFALVGQCVASSSGGSSGDCEYGRTGRYC